MKDDEDNVFGVYASEQLGVHHKYYGTGETFLFTFYKTDKMHCFHSCGANDYYIYSDSECIAFGGSEGSFSLYVKDNFLNGYTKQGITFRNPPLTDKENFFLSKFEVWTFEEK